MRPSTGLVGLLLVLAPSVLAQQGLPNLSTVTEPQGKPTESATGDDAKSTDAPSTAAPSSSAAPSSAQSSAASTSLQDAVVTNAPPASSTAPTKSEDGPATSLGSIFHISDAPTIAGYGIPQVGVPDTAGAPFMQKSNLPDGTVFICVGAALGFFGAAILAWRGLVAWSLHRSVKRAAMTQNLSDLKSMSALPHKKRGMYNVVGASSNMSLDRLSAAPPGQARPPKPFASPNNGSTPPRATSSLFFSPTAGGAAGNRDSVANRSSSYLPAGYYPTGNAQPAQGSPMTHVGGNHNGHLSAISLTPGNRFSTRSGISPPGSPSLPPSRGYDRAPGSRDGLSNYNRNSMATLGTPGTKGVYGNGHENVSQLSLNVPGGSSVAGGRAPSAYLEDLFENHGNGPRERF